jgi:hypothetical protein
MSTTISDLVDPKTYRQGCVDRWFEDRQDAARTLLISFWAPRGEHLLSSVFTSQSCDSAQG